MNCPKCGSLLPQGAQFCNVCNEPLLNTGYVPYGQAPAGYPQQGYAQSYQLQVPPGQNPQGYPPQGQQAAYQQQIGAQAQGYAPQYGQQNYPTGYQQAYEAYYAQQPKRREPGAFLGALAHLPRMFVESLRNPGTVLQGMMERHDVYTAPVVAALVLLLTFLCAMVVTRGGVELLFRAISSWTGTSLAGDAAGLSQGVSYIAGRIAPSIGGIAALCQLLAMAFPVVVALVYLCAVCKVRFSWELLCGFVTLTTLPMVAGSILCMLASLITPALALILAAVNMAVGLVIMTSLLGRVIGRTDQQLMPVKFVCVSVSIFLTLLILLFVGGTLMGGVVNTIMGNISSLL